MRKSIHALLLAGFALTMFSAWAGKDYQVTGAVVEVTDTKITIQKGKEKFEMDRNATTKIPADVKVGDKVTAFYSMTATEVETKATKKK